MAFALYVFNNLNCNYSTIFNDALYYFNYILNIRDTLLSFSCIAKQYYAYVELVASALLPIIAAIAFLCIYYVRKKSNLSKNGLVQKSITLYYLITPAITFNYLQFLECWNIDGIYYLYNDMGIECWEGTHLILSLSLAIPSFVFWIIIL